MERISSFYVFVCVVCLKIKVFVEHKAAVFVVIADFEVENKEFVWSIRPAEHLKVESFGIPEKTPSLGHTSYLSRTGHFSQLKQGGNILINLTYRYGPAELCEVVMIILIRNIQRSKIRNKVDVAIF